MTATAGLPGCLAVQRDEFCHPHYIEGCLQQNKTVVPLGNLSPPWEAVTSFMDMCEILCNKPLYFGKVHTVMLYRRHRIMKTNSRCIKTNLQNGIRTHIFSRASETKAGAPPDAGHGHRRRSLSAATCRARSPGRLWWQEWHPRHLSHDCSSHVFLRLSNVLGGKIVLLSPENLHQLSPFVAFFFFFKFFSRARNDKLC